MPYVFLKGGREGAQAVWNSRQLEWQGKRLKNGMVGCIPTSLKACLLAVSGEKALSFTTQGSSKDPRRL